MNIEEIDGFVFVDPAEMSVSPDGIVECLRDRWWPVDKDGRIGFSLGLWTHMDSTTPVPGFPVCNQSHEIAEWLRTDGGANRWAVRVVFFPFIFRERSIGDFT